MREVDDCIYRMGLLTEGKWISLQMGCVRCSEKMSCNIKSSGP